MKMTQLVLGIGLSKCLLAYLEPRLAGNEIELISVENLERGVEELDARQFQLVVADLGQFSGVERVAAAPSGALTLWRLILCNWGKWLKMSQLLDSGADVCLPNNVPPPVIAGQIRALLRRSISGLPPGPGPERFIRGEIEIIPQYHQIRIRGKEIKLSRTEFKLLMFLAGRPGIVFSMTEISRCLWTLEDIYSRNHTIENLILALRKKLEVDPRHPAYILTIRGVGYCFVSNYSETRGFSEDTVRYTQHLK